MTSSFNVTFSFAKNGNHFEALSFPFSIHFNDDPFVDCHTLPFYPSYALKNAAVSMNFGTSTFVYAPDVSSRYCAVSSARLHHFNLSEQLLRIHIPSAALCEERLITVTNRTVNNVIQSTTETSSKEQLQTAIRQKLFVRGKTGNTLLHQAISCSNWDACTTLIQMLMCLPETDRREFISLKNRQGKTALHIALIKTQNNFKFAVLLVKAGFSLFVKDNKDFMTPLEYIAHDPMKRDILFRCGGNRQAFAIFLAGNGFLTLRIKSPQQKEHPGKIEPR